MTSREQFLVHVEGARLVGADHGVAERAEDLRRAIGEDDRRQRQRGARHERDESLQRGDGDEPQDDRDQPDQRVRPGEMTGAARRGHEFGTRRVAVGAEIRQRVATGE